MAYPKRPAVSCTRWIFRLLTFPFPLSTLDTVPWETPAAFAISLMVAIASPHMLFSIAKKWNKSMSGFMNSAFLASIRGFFAKY